MWSEAHAFSQYPGFGTSKCTCFGSTYTKIGTIQRRLAWPLRKDDTQNREAFHISCPRDSFQGSPHFKCMLCLIAKTYTQSPIIRTGPIRLSAEFLEKFKTRALGTSNLRTTSKNLRTASAQIFKAKNQVLLPFLIHMYISFTCTYISSNFSLF